MSFKKFVAPLAVVAALMMVSGTTFAQSTQIATGGTTNVKLSTSFLNALGGLNISAGVIAPTNLVSSTVNFPIIGGAIDLNTAMGNLEHSGGLTLTQGNTVLAIQNFTIDTTGTTPVVTGIAVLNNQLLSRLTLFDVVLPSGFKVPLKEVDGVFLHLGSVTLNLDPGAAATLNSVFNTTGFTGGSKIGTATVDAFTNAE